MKAIRVLIIDDSAFMRKMISGIVASDNRLEVTATAKNGVDGLEKIKSLAPDVVTLDVEMPIMDGITTLQNIMNTNPLPVVMVSSVTSEGAAKTVQAISYGAIDFIVKPSGSISLDINDLQQEIITKIITAFHARIPMQNQTMEQKINRDTTSGVKTSQLQHSKSIVVIGASTGGPRALQHVLADLPSDFNAPILIVQHIPAGFSKSLANRLNTLSKIHVKEAVHGEIIHDQTAYIAPGNTHMCIRKVGTVYAIELIPNKGRHAHIPSVDVLFGSLAEIKRINKIAIVLTGMGNDGSIGIKQIKKRDSNTIVIAQSEESSIVYGMPKAAVKTGYVTYIAHLHQIGKCLTNTVENPGGI